MTEHHVYSTSSATQGGGRHQDHNSNAPAGAFGEEVEAVSALANKLVDYFLGTAKIAAYEVTLTAKQIPKLAALVLTSLPIILLAWIALSATLSSAIYEFVYPSVTLFMVTFFVLQLAALCLIRAAAHKVTDKMKFANTRESIRDMKDLIAAESGH